MEHVIGAELAVHQRLAGRVVLEGIGQRIDSTINDVQAALHAILFLHQDEMHVPTVAANRIELHVPAHAQALIDLVLRRVPFQFRDFLVVAGGLTDAAGSEPPQRAQNGDDNQPELHVFVHGKSSPAPTVESIPVYRPPTTWAALRHCDIEGTRRGYRPRPGWTSGRACSKS